MLNAFQNSLVIIACITAALLCLFIFRRCWLPRTATQHNDVIGLQIAFLGTTYAVIIAFMLSDVWNNYRAAAANTENEANALINIYRLADGLPLPQNGDLQSLSRQYAQLMVSEEWPNMAKGKFSQRGFQVMSQMWKVLIGTRPGTKSEEAIFERLLTDVTNLTEHRRIRHLESRSNLPEIFWLLLIVGGIMTVLYSCLFVVEDIRLHVVQVTGITFIVSLVLVTIADVDAPYGGALHISSDSFVTALGTMGNRSN